MSAAPPGKDVLDPLLVAPAVVDWVERMHGVVDELVAPLVAAHGARLRCRSGCNDCCSDGLSVFAVEAAVIRRHHAALLAEAEPHLEGACAFLDGDGACRIYEHRPYVCRTQGLPLRWLEQDAVDGEQFEARDVCPLNVEGGPALEELGADQCWTLGPFEERLALQQRAVESAGAAGAAGAEGTGGAGGLRIPLRSLFEGGRRRLPIVG